MMTENPYICLSQGGFFDLVEPENSQFTIEELAHSLSNICRFNGHCSEFYSVAQHSVLVSMIVYPGMAYQGLMHDIAEAIIGDVTSPLKYMLPDYKHIERRIEGEMFKRFGLFKNDLVKKADLIALATEKRDLLGLEKNIWSLLEDIKPIATTIRPMGPEQAKKKFLDRYAELTDGSFKHAAIN